MTVIKWLGTTAVALAIGTGGVIAQSQRDLPQKGEDSPRAQSPKDADRPAATEQRQGVRETQRGEDKAAPERRQAQQPSQSRDSQQPTKQSQDQPARGERPAPGTTQQTQDEQKGRDSKQPTKQSQEQPARGERPPVGTTQQTQDQRGRDAKQPADQRQQQTRDQQKQDTQARDAKQPTDSTRQQSQQQQPDRGGQATQPPGARPADTAQDPQRPAAGQATDQTTQRGQTTSATVNDQQRTQIIEKLRSDRTAARTTQNLNIQVNIGQQLPPRVRPRLLPPDIVRIAPQYRGYEYTVVEDEIVIVEPRSRRVVDVLSERGPAQATARVGHQQVVLSQEQRETFRQVARRTTTGSTSPSGSVADSNCLTLQPVPEELVRANPQFESYRYLAIGEQLVLIDPREQKVVEVVD
jgi:Protein of unknown function (DUF1236)